MEYSVRIPAEPRFWPVVCTCVSSVRCYQPMVVLASIHFSCQQVYTTV